MYTMNERELFFVFLQKMMDTYPEANLYREGTLIYANNECIFNIEGFNLLYNTKRLCDHLAKEGFLE